MMTDRSGLIPSPRRLSRLANSILLLSFTDAISAVHSANSYLIKVNEPTFSPDLIPSAIVYL
jgi:hypothetical protein